MKKYKCLECGKVNTAELWDLTTIKALVSDITSITEEDNCCFYVCPSCNKEIEFGNIRPIIIKDSRKIIVFEYKNWKGETSIRKVVPIDLWFGDTEFHKEEQWLLKAYDMDKNAERDFALTDIIRYIKQ